MQIDYLANHPEFIRTIATWHFQEWGSIKPEKTVEWRIENLQKQLNPQSIPLTFVAIAESLPVGSASLVENDLPIRQHLSPWLASVYVPFEQRNKGIGSAIVNRIVKKAHTLNIPILFLFTFDKAKLYLRLGWKVLEETQYLDYDITVMNIETHTVEIDDSVEEGH